MLTEDRLDDLTMQYGGEYSLNHTKRILKIISLIGVNYKFNHEIVTISAYLHDWGAYPPWIVKGADHAQRSAEVAAQFLESEMFDKNDIIHIAECIKNHHNGYQGKSLEAKLISDADGIDFIGVIGVIRNFSTRTKELRKAYDSSKARMNLVRENICLEESKSLVEKRIERMNIFFNQFDEETFGIF